MNRQVAVAAGFRASALVEKGQAFDDGSGNVARVTRRSATSGWVDVVVTQRGGLDSWTKRMPHGIPTAWTEVTRHSTPKQPPADKTHWTIAELRAEAEARFGQNVLDFAYQCPSCNDIATMRDFRDAIEWASDAARAAGRECIGRHVEDRGCNWTSYGLFKGPWFITMDDAKATVLTAFPLAPAAAVTR